MQQLQRLLVVAACALLFILHFSNAQKSYRIDAIETNIYVPEAGSCVVSVKEKYSITFSGGSYSKLGIPIRKDSVYAVSSNPATMVTGLQASLPVSSPMVVAADANDKETAYMIILNFPASTGSVTFEFEYNINGYLHTNGNNNEVRYSTKWNDATVDSLTTRVHFPASFALRPEDITMNPVYYGTKNNNTVEYKMSSLTPGTLYLTQTTIPVKTDACKPAPISPLAYILPVIGAVLFLCVCIPVCVCLGCLTNTRRRLFGQSQGGYYSNTSTYSAPGYYNNGYNNGYNNNSSFGYNNHHHHHGHHNHHGHSHHSHSHSSGGHSGKSAGVSGGSGFAA